MFAVLYLVGLGCRDRRRRVIRRELCAEDPLARLIAELVPEVVEARALLR